MAYETEFSEALIFALHVWGIPYVLNNVITPIWFWLANVEHVTHWVNELYGKEGVLKYVYLLLDGSYSLLRVLLYFLGVSWRLPSATCPALASSHNPPLLPTQSGGASKPSPPPYSSTHPHVTTGLCRFLVWNKGIEELGLHKENDSLQTWVREGGHGSKVRMG